jgi:isoleucyl-tRNA synthetase
MQNSEQYCKEGRDTERDWFQSSITSSAISKQKLLKE